MPCLYKAVKNKDFKEVYKCSVVKKDVCPYPGNETMQYSYIFQIADLFQRSANASPVYQILSRSTLKGLCGVAQANL
jgi:hypothetical protein